MRLPLTVAVAQPAVVAGDLRATALAHAEAVRAARARLVVFPELSLTGYELDVPPVALDDSALAPLADACRDTRCVALAGAPVEEDGRRYIAALRFGDDGSVEVAYRKSFLGGDEVARFAAGEGPVAFELDGRRIGVGICKDTGVDGHVSGVAALGVDLYVAGLVHGADELEEQDRRGVRIARACGAPVAFASFAGPTGGGYDATAGVSTIWAADGAVLARAGRRPGEIAQAALP